MTNNYNKQENKKPTIMLNWLGHEDLVTKMPKHGWATTEWKQPNVVKKKKMERKDHNWHKW